MAKDPCALTSPTLDADKTVEHLRKNLPPHIRDAARCAEWAHRRPNKPTQHGVHSVSLTGHPLHWDNDGAEADGQSLADVTSLDDGEETTA